MEQQGFCLIVSGIIPDEALVRSLSIERNALDRLASPESPTYLTPADRRQEWQQLMEHNFNLDVLVLLRYFGTTKGGSIWQGPIIHNLAPSSTGTGLRRAHPCREAISIWRPVGRGLGPENGLFKVYPGSHHIRTEDELRNSKIDPVEIRVRADQVLITYGGLWIEEGSGDGILIWMGVSVEIIGLHIDKYCLAFVAEAYNASLFLSRTLSPGLVNAEAGPTLDDSFFPQTRLMRPGEHRSDTVDTFFAHALECISRIVEYFEKLDPTGVTLAACCAVDDPRTAFLTVERGTDIRKWFLRALAVRYLVRRYHSRGGTIKDFIRAENLPDTSQLRNTIRHGKKLYWLEQYLEKPSIWIALLGVLSRLDHLSYEEVYSMSGLIHRYPELLDTPEEWSPLMDGSSQLLGVLSPGGC
ncbi:hypothetical protein ASPSYDRAFT_164973 [Aspergillus sydowii CBS 593.65]|uniref:Uncharacterized protein n=1 Tax=Aspergillus sydowii CBS 593.65 TaxID=1036612 RepID=A0A1L9SYR8_9EURO|nr:uncharacterized protein ASPSYDRAFT_164973 [Aspergillus sydowii CBS 593.65]OJJ52296.1 hypothetical protein ASPSYDRAFT_164973 [Aspergillus sydowii CBS 593.65]